MVSTVDPSRSTVIEFGDLGQFVELVGDHDRRHALLLELEQEIEQRGAVGLVQARRRLVEDQELHLLRQRLGDLDQLLLADAYVGDQRIGGFLQAHRLHQLAAAAEGFVPVDDAVPRRLVAQKHIFGDRELRRERKLLVDDDDADMLAVGDPVETALFALIEDLAFVGAERMDPAEHFHQRGFSSAVLAAKGVDLAFLNRKIDVPQGDDPRELFGDAPHFEDCRHFSAQTLLRRTLGRLPNAGQDKFAPPRWSAEAVFEGALTEAVRPCSSRCRPASASS